MSPRSHDANYVRSDEGLIGVGMRVAFREVGGYGWGRPQLRSGTVVGHGTIPGMSRRARRFGLRLPVYEVKLADGASIVTVAGKAAIWPL